MANFTYLENAHVFSKAPVQLSMEASSAVNKSAHTVQSDEVWGEVCPFITKNDVSGLTEDTLFEIEGHAPVKFNYKKPAIELDAINNNGMKSNGYVAKVIISGKPVTQFIADTDVTDENGTLAAGYRAVLYDKKGKEVPDSKYTINYSNGLIYFKDPIESTTESYYTLSFFTYEGKKLSSSLEDISTEINKIETDYKAADKLINEDITELQKHASTSNIHVTDEERAKWNSAIQNGEGDDYISVVKDENDLKIIFNADYIEKNNQISFPASYSNNNDAPHYVGAYGFEYKALSTNIWVQSIEVNVALPEVIDNLNEFGHEGSFIIPNKINERVCKILVAEGLTNTYLPNFKPETDEKILGISEYNICKKDENGNISETLSFIFENPIHLESGKDYRFYFFDKNENLYGLPILINIYKKDNFTANRNEVASRYLIGRYDYYGVYLDRLPNNDSYIPGGLKVKLSKCVHSAFVAHNSNNDIHVSESDRLLWNKAETALQEITAGSYIDIVNGNNINVTNVSSTISEDNDNNLITVNPVRIHTEDLDSHLKKNTIKYTYNNAPDGALANALGSTLAYGFVLKAQENGYLNSLKISLVCPVATAVNHIYNPGNFTGKGDLHADLASFPPVYLKVTNIASGEVIGTSQIKNLSDDVWNAYKNKLENDYGLNIGFTFEQNIPLVKGISYAITAYHANSTNSNFLLPILIKITDDKSSISSDAPRTFILNENLNGFLADNIVSSRDNTNYYLEAISTGIHYTVYRNPGIAINEKAIFDHANDKTLHNSSELIYNTVWATESKFIDNIEWDEIVQGTEQANCGGFRFILDKEVTCNAIEVFDIESINNDASKAAYIKIWKQNADSTSTLVAASKYTTTLGEPNPETWLLKNEVTLLPNTRYTVTFNDNNSSHQFAAGWPIRFTKMATYSGTDVGFHILASGGTGDYKGNGNYYCPKFVLKTAKEFTTIPVLEDRVNQYIANANTATISTNEVITPISESITLNDETKAITFNISDNENIAIVSYTPHIAADINVISSITNNEISFDISKKDSTIAGEYFFVLEILYIDKILKQVKRSYGYTGIIIE